MSSTARAWLDLAGTAAPTGGSRFELKPGLTLLGGPRGDLPVSQSGNDCLHLWSHPPKLVFVGSGQAPRVNGQEVQEISLRHGDQIQWRDLLASFGYDDGEARLEEVPAQTGVASAPGRAPMTSPISPVSAPRAPAAAVGEAAAPPRSAAATLAPTAMPMGQARADAPGGATWAKLKAGLIAEMNLGDPAAARRWQEAVVRGEFDADGAARDLLASAPGLPDDDRRLADRSTRLMRDLLMSSVTKNPMRQVRKAARHGLAFVLVQLMIFLLFTLLVLAGLLLVHVRFDVSIDGFLEGVLDFF